MKILQITPYFYPSKYGTEHYTYKLTEQLHKLGHKVDVLTINTENAKPEEELFGGVNVFRAKQNFGYERGLVSIDFTRKILNSKNYDIYHIQAPAVYCLPVSTLASKINKIPLIATDHGHIAEGVFLLERLNNISTSFYKKININFIDRIIFFTKSYYESLYLKSTITNKVRIIPPAIDIEKFNQKIDCSQLKKQYNLDEKNQILLFVGALRASYRQKGIDYLIKAMVKVKDVFPNVKLFIVGGGGLVLEYRNLVSQLKLDENIIFTGPVFSDLISHYYAMCDIFVLPSYAEAYGFVLLEAMASGKPVIACEIPGAGEIVQEGVTGMKTQPRDTESLADTIIYMLEDKELLKRMGLNARKHVESRTWEEVTKETIKVYEEVM